MTKLTRNIFLLMTFYVAIALQSASAQSVLDPNDPVITYDSTRPPVQPPDGQIGKWVRTVRMDWNTDMYKAYIYKGLAFRLHFPKTYNPTANDGKKYPIMLFFHGHGEYGPITDNEFHLLHGHQGFDQAIQQGTYDGYVLSAQSTDFFNITDYDRIMQVVNYMIANNKVDPFHITVNGLSQGGQACWEMLSTYPTYISGCQPMSWSQTSYTDPTFINKIKYTPNWVFQGTEDTNPYPSTTYSVRDAMVAAGANFRLTVYQGVGHGTWWNAWGEPDFWPFINRAYSSNPWQVGGSKSYWPGTAINAVLGLPAGFAAYEWRKDGVQISGATSNTINATSGGVYTARVQRNGVWSDWSHVPVTILPGHYEAEDYSAMFGIQTENTSDVGGGKDVGWIELGDYMDYSINVGTTGTLTLNLRVATPVNGAQLKVKKSDGTVLATVNIPNTSGWQVFQTISTPINLTAGQQTLRIESSSTAGWNINWFEFNLGSSGNVPPTVNAGPSQVITLPANNVTLNGTASDPDGTIATYNWTKVTGGAATITSPSSASTTITGLVQGSYNFRLTVTDNLGASSSSDVTVTVNGNNQPPVANAGPDQTITLPTNNVTLTGTASDADGSVATYAWTKTSGSTATINTPSSASTTVTGLVQGSYTFRLTVTDNQGAISTDDVNIIVNDPPPPGSGTRIEAENWSAMSGVLTEACSDAGGTLDVGWIDNGDWMDYTINVPAAGNYTLNLRIASPNTGAQFLIKNSSGIVLSTLNVPTTGGWQVWQTISTTINLVAGTQTIRLQANSTAGWNINWMELVGATATNQAPTANAGADQTITLPVNSVSLAGSGTDVDGTIVTYAWTKLTGGAATITSPSSASTTITGLVAGSYTFRLTVTDNSGASTSDDVIVTVNAATANQPPTVNAGLDQTITLPVSSVNLSGTASDADGSIVTYAWTRVTGTGGTISSPGTPSTSVTGLSAGSYTFRLTVTDNSGASTSDDVIVTVNAATANQPPTVNAGQDQTITLPVSSVNLSGTASDADGSIVTYAWTRVTGTGGTISSPGTPSTSVTGLVAGSYTFRLTVTDNSGASTSDDVIVTVNAATANQPPTVNAGLDQTITLPVSSVNLSGTASDADGSIVTYAWTRVTGTGGTISSPGTPSTSVTGLSAGSYTFRLTVTDNSGASTSDDVIVTVNAATANQPPTVNAGLDQTITLPVSSVNLSGTASDADGSIVTYAWTRVTGTGGTISSPGTPSTSVTGLSAGSYTFRLTVTDNSGASTSDDVIVTVNAATANQPPTVNAGLDQTITLPVSSVNLSGTASDADGSIVTYAWTKVTGTGGTISSPGTPSTSVTGLTAGSYTFRLTVTDNSGATTSDDVIVTVNQQPTPVFSVKIEAESFTNTTAAVTKTATSDVGGGQQVGGLDNGDVLNYTVDVPYSGTYTANFRVGATKGGSKLLLLNNAGTLLATINVPNTGSAWQTVSVSINLTAGSQQTFKVQVNKSSGNPIFNWWELNLTSLSAARASTNTRGEVTESTIPGKLQVYPSPARDQLIVELNHPYAGSMNVQVLNFAGAVQKEYSFARTSGTSRHVISLSMLPKGEYILAVIINGTRESRKFIKL